MKYIGARGLPPLRRTKLSKESQERQDEMFKNYMRLIGGGTIGNSNCIGTNLNSLILNITPKELSNFLLFQKDFTLVKLIEQLIFLVNKV